VNRIIVLGGQGLFGRTAVEQLRRLGFSPLIAGRQSTAEIQINADDAALLRATLLPGDLIIDTAGPFQHRTLALLHAAIEIGCDIVDINDNVAYAQQVLTLEADIARAGIRVLSSASSVSAIAAAVVHESGIENPVRISCFLAPASRHTANRGSALSLIQSVGCPVRVFREGQLKMLPGWSEPRQFLMPSPLGNIHSRLFESADAIYLPRIWPTLQTVDMFVDTNTPGVNALLSVSAHSATIRRLLSRGVNLGTKISRIIGSSVGGIGYEIEDAAGRIVRLAISSAENSFLIAIAPAVLAAQALATGHFDRTGLILPHQHVSAAELWAFLKSQGIEIVRLP
jgi:NAD(P)-dependent dehydrogenase (short-subunit alcohol dehydrogenase family)